MVFYIEYQGHISLSEPLIKPPVSEMDSQELPLSFFEESFLDLQLVRVDPFGEACVQLLLPGELSGQIGLLLFYNDSLESGPPAHELAPFLSSQSPCDDFLLGSSESLQAVFVIPQSLYDI